MVDHHLSTTTALLSLALVRLIRAPTRSCVSGGSPMPVLGRFSQKELASRGDSFSRYWRYRVGEVAQMSRIAAIRRGNIGHPGQENSIIALDRFIQSTRDSG